MPDKNYKVAFAACLASVATSAVAMFGIRLQYLSYKDSNQGLKIQIESLQNQLHESKKEAEPDSTDQALTNLHTYLNQKQSSGQYGFEMLVNKILIASGNSDFAKELHESDTLEVKLPNSFHYSGNDYEGLGPYMAIGGSKKLEVNSDLADFKDVHKKTYSVHVYTKLGWARQQNSEWILDAKADNASGSSLRMVRLEMEFFNVRQWEKYWDEIVRLDPSNDSDKRRLSKILERINLISFPIRWTYWEPDNPNTKHFQPAWTMKEGIPKSAYDIANRVNRFVNGSSFPDIRQWAKK